MNSTTANIQKVSFVFFAIIGFSHIMSGLLLANNYYPHVSFIIHRSLDIPFVISAVLYALSSIRQGFFPSGELKFRDYIGMGIGAGVIVLAIYVNFFIPDRPVTITENAIFLN